MHHSIGCNNITFSIERIIDEGTLDEADTVASEVQKSKDTVQMVDEEEHARVAKKLKASADENKNSNRNTDEGDKEKKKEEEMVVENESQSQEIGEKLIEEKEVLNNKVAVDMMQKVAVETEREEEEREEELVDFEDSQDKLGDQEEDDVLESQESFTTKVNKITVVSKSSEELIVVKWNMRKLRARLHWRSPGDAQG
jgi:hypothetical protein